MRGYTLSFKKSQHVLAFQKYLFFSTKEYSHKEKKNPLRRLSTTVGSSPSRKIGHSISELERVASFDAMDYSNCSWYWATDQVFERTVIGSCDSPLLVIWILFPVLIFFRLAVALRKWIIYYSQPASRKSEKYPWGPLLATSLGVCYAIVFVLLLTDVANVGNGVSFSIYTICYVQFAVIYSRSLIRTVRLGVRITTVNRDLEKTKSGIEKFDRLLYFLSIMGGVGICTMSVVLIIMGPMYPEASLLLGRIGWISKACFQFAVTSALVWQLQRCYLLIDICLPESPRKNLVLAKLRRSQLHYFIFGTPGAVLFILLSTRVILWYWYVFCFH